MSHDLHATPHEVNTEARALILAGKPIPSDLAGKVTAMNLWNTEVTDLTPLAGLTALQKLHLAYTEVTDLTPLAGLTALQTLYLQNTKVTDLAPLAGLTALQELHLAYTEVTDLTPVKHVKHLYR